MSRVCSTQFPIRSAASAFATLGLVLALAHGAAAQQPDEALVGELARVLQAADARAFDATLFRSALQSPELAVRRAAALAAGQIGDPAALDLLIPALGDSVPV